MTTVGVLAHDGEPFERTMPWALDGGHRQRAKKFEASLLHGRLLFCAPTP